MSTSITIRGAWPGDIGVIRLIDPWARPPERAQAMSKQIGLGMSWIAEFEGRTAGYAIVTPGFFARPLVERIFVLDPYRRQGVATALLQRCETSYDSDQVFISTNVSNAAMRGVLSKAAFKDSGVVLGIEDGDPELIYMKRRAPNLTFVKFRPRA